MPLLAPLPLKLNPTTVKAPMMSFSLATTASTWRIAFEVYSTDAPCGACTVIMNHP